MNVPLGWDAVRNVPVWVWLIVAALLVCQATWIFNDARKRGYNAWAWGAYGLMNFPGSLIVYRLVTGIREASGWGGGKRSGSV